MKAVAFSEHGSVDVLQSRDFPDPVEGNKNVIVDVEYCGVNHLDIWTRMGIAGKRIRLPHICGCDIVGTVRGERVVMLRAVALRLESGTMTWSSTPSSSRSARRSE